jgi:uncharacterized membrane protein YhhN
MVAVRARLRLAAVLLAIVLAALAGHWLWTDTTGMIRFLASIVSFFLGQLVAVVWISRRCVRAAA